MTTAITPIYRRLDLATLQARLLRRFVGDIELVWLYGGNDIARALLLAADVGATVELVAAGVGHSAAMRLRRQALDRAREYPAALCLDDDVIPFRAIPPVPWHRDWGGEVWTAAYLKGEESGPAASAVRICCAYDLPAELAFLREAYTHHVAHAEMIAGSLLHLDKGTVGHDLEQAGAHIALVRAFCRGMGIAEPDTFDVLVNQSPAARMAQGAVGLSAAIAGRGLAGATEIATRREICGACSSRQVMPGGISLCGPMTSVLRSTAKTCGCAIWAKTKLAAASCPLGKWLASGGG